MTSVIKGIKSWGITGLYIRLKKTATGNIIQERSFTVSDGQTHTL